MTHYSDNLWADEMGIDLEELAREHPMHPDQLRLKRVIRSRLQSIGLGSVSRTPGI
jgi:hypothetical protein